MEHSTLPSPLARILVVEDNPISLKLLRLALTADGFEVVEASSGAEALRAVAATPPDLILQDLILGDVDGFALAGQLRAAVDVTRTPMLAISGLAGAEALARAAGFCDFLLKPVAPSRLLQAVRLHLSGGRSLAPAAAPHVLVVDDDALQRKVLALGLERAGLRVSVAVNGRQALRLAIAERPAAIVTDLLMPEMDGLELCAALRRDPTLASIPVLLVTSGRIDDGDRALAIEAGARLVLERAPGVDVVLEPLRALLSGEPAGAAAPAQERPSRLRLRAVRRLAHDVAQRDELAQMTDLWQSTLALLDRLALGAPTQDDVATGKEILGSVLHTFGFPQGVLFTARPDGSLSVRSSLGYSGRDEARVAALLGRQALLQAAMERNEPVALTADGVAGGEHECMLAGAGARSMLLLPLVAGGQRLGLVLAAHPDGSPPSRWRALSDAMRTPIAQAFLVGRTVAQLAASEQRFRRIAESMGDALVVADARGEILFANPAASRIFGGSTERPRRNLGEIVPFLDERQDVQSGEGIRPDGSRVPVETSSFVMREANELHRVLVVRDLSDLRRMAELEHLAARDPLTSLHNRRRFDEELGRHLAESRRHGSRGALLMVDLDRFKAINDTHGHPAGDAVLVAVARCLTESTRESDFVARLGGDEFAILLPHSDEAGARACARKIQDRLRAMPVRFGSHDLTVAASIGLAVYPDAGDTGEALVAAADSAMYASKNDSVKDAGPIEVTMGSEARS